MGFESVMMCPRNWLVPVFVTAALPMDRRGSDQRSADGKRNFTGAAAGRAKFPFGGVDNPDRGENLPIEVVIENRPRSNSFAASNVWAFESGIGSFATRLADQRRLSRWSACGGQYWSGLRA